MRDVFSPSYTRFRQQACDGHLNRIMLSKKEINNARIQIMSEIQAQILQMNV